MQGLWSTNNAWGWLCYFAAHLIKNCGIERKDVIAAVLRESDAAMKYWWQDQHGWTEGYENHPEWKRVYMSDNQCIMMSNKWFYLTDEKNQYFIVPELTGKLDVSEFWDGVEEHLV